MQTKYWYEAKTSDGYIWASSDDEALSSLSKEFNGLEEILYVYVQVDEYKNRSVWELR